MMVSVQSQKIKTYPILNLLKNEETDSILNTGVQYSVIKPYVWKRMIRTHILKFNYFGKINGTIFGVFLVTVCEEAHILRTSGFCVRNVPNTITIVPNMYSFKHKH
jgi:hypothetical protein